MSNRIAEVVIIAEDARSFRFLQRYVNRAVDRRKIRAVLPSKGRQSAFDWVIAMYPKEVAEQRNRVAKGKNNAALVVHVDTDTKSVDQRIGQLGKALKVAQGAMRSGLERIAIVVPKRNIETWIHGLCGVDVERRTTSSRTWSIALRRIERSARGSATNESAPQLKRCMRSRVATPLRRQSKCHRWRRPCRNCVAWSAKLHR